MTISFFCDILWETRGFIVINSFSKKYGIPRYDRGADGELKLASFCLSGRSCSAPGRLDLVQLQPLNGLLYIAPPPMGDKKLILLHNFNIIIRKILFLGVVFLLSLAICSCDNLWMKDILQERTITFDSNGGSPVPSQKLLFGERVTRPADPYKDNCVFSGWYKDNETLKLYDFNYIPNDDMTLYAKWELIPALSIDELIEFLSEKPSNDPFNPYKVRLKVNDGEIGNIKTVLDDAQNKYVSLDLSGSTIREIPAYAFSQCDTLIGVKIPDSVETIFRGAFNECSNLTNINIPNGVTSIGSGAFSNCISLTSITIPGSVEDIDDFTFQYCTSLSSVTLGNGVKFIGEEAFAYTNLTSIIIPDSVETIFWGAFLCCTNLSSVTLGNNVNTIGGYSFSMCTNLTSITIPNSVTSIGADAFLGCNNLETIIVASGNTEYSAENGILYNINKTTLHSYPTAGKTTSGFFTIPPSVQSIGDWAFSHCTNLANVTIGSGVNIIGAYAFSRCTNLANVTIGSDVTTIRAYAFLGCNNLANVTIGSGVTSIEANAFSNTGLTSVTFQRDNTTFNATVFPGNLRDKYLAVGGGTGTYTRSGLNTDFTKQ